jgi:hypothetical protein
MTQLSFDAKISFALVAFVSLRSKFRWSVVFIVDGVAFNALIRMKQVTFDQTMLALFNQFRVVAGGNSPSSREVR